MQRIHQMPFGAQSDNTGETRFRLWAPGCGHVCLHLEGHGQSRDLAMDKRDGGWFELTAAAPPGTRYSYGVGGGLRVPDPVSRFNPDDVHGASEVIDPRSYRWSDDGWGGRPWSEVVIYELHVGSFSPEANFAGLTARLDYLADLGVTAIELMPVADFPGQRNWGYDGVLLYAPDARYGRPEQLKALIDAAHRRGLMVFLDVVYNHFGPEGNYLHCYAPQFFSSRHQTPWGAAINFDGEDARTVRDFYIHNALYWLEEYHLDGLRFDAVHAIRDVALPDIVEEIAAAVRQGPARERHIHLILENDLNQASYLRRAKDGRAVAHNAQWNDDLHHALHVILTGETDGYYVDYAGQAVAQLGRGLAEGFIYQGEPSEFRGGKARGEPSAGLPPQAFVNFLQTHDQVGNRAFGERLGALTPKRSLLAAAEIVLLAPSIPMLFMGEEFAAQTPFLFFCDFGPDLAKAVTQGRRREFARFERFSDPMVRDGIPDPNAIGTYLQSKLDWSESCAGFGAACLTRYRELLALRRQWIAPRLPGMPAGGANWRLLEKRAITVAWRMGDGSLLRLDANLAETDVACDYLSEAKIIYQSAAAKAVMGDKLEPWATRWTLVDAAK